MIIFAPCYQQKYPENRLLSVSFATQTMYSFIV